MEIDSFWLATIYGLVQGLGEFLPISSSGHLALLPFFFNSPDPGLFFDLLMHLGTTAALGLYFFWDFHRLFTKGIRFLNPSYTLKKYREGKISLESMPTMVVSTLATIILVLALQPLQGWTRHPLWIAFSLSFFGVLLWHAQWCVQKKPASTGVSSALGPSLISAIHLREGLFIGLAQGLAAIFPGASRSGVTLTAGLYQGIPLVQTARFSFLLSFPIILLAMLSKIKELLDLMGARQWVAVDSVFTFSETLWALFVAFISGLLVIHFFLKLLQRISFHWFLLYRLLLAGSIVLMHYQL